MKKSKLLTPREVAEMLNVHILTLRNWRNKKISRGPSFVKIGRKVMYREVDVQSFIENGYKDIEEQKLTA